MAPERDPTEEPEEELEPQVRLDGEGNPVDDQRLVYRAVDQWPLALVLLGVAVGLAVLAFVDFRLGSLLIGGSVVFAGALRTVLTRDRAGLLAVRSRTIDLVTVYSLGIAVTTLALLVPPPR